MTTDSTLMGLVVGHKKASATRIYSSGYGNIWMSRFWAKDDRGRNNLVWGDEATLVKRMLQTNHEYRRGINRLPHVAYQYVKTSALIIPGAGKLFTRYKNDNLFPEAFYRNNSKSSDTISPLFHEFRRGCEIWDVSADGNASRISAQGESNQWRYTSTDLMNSQVSARVIFNNSCHTGAFGGITNASLLSKNSACVLAMGPTDYCGPWPQFSIVDTAFYPHVKQLKYMAHGDRWGRAYLRSNGFLWTTVFFGDLTLKPKMAPHNLKPFISDIQVTKTGTLSWSFIATAHDPDDSITGYDWYGDSYRMGIAEPDSSGLSNTFSITYNSVKICTLRVEVVDNFRARDYATVVLHTDSGVISKTIATSHEKNGIDRDRTIPQLFLQPNPFSSASALTISFPVSFGYNGNVTAHIYDMRGRLVKEIFESDENSANGSIMWNGTNNKGELLKSGVYFVKLSNSSVSVTRRVTLLR